MPESDRLSQSARWRQAALSTLDGSLLASSNDVELAGVYREDVLAAADAAVRVALERLRDGQPTETHMCDVCGGTGELTSRRQQR